MIVHFFYKTKIFVYNKMSKEYDATITKDYATYSNINSYGHNSRPVSIVAPVTASFLPEIFYHMRPHPLPHWMTPYKQGTNCDQYSYQSDAYGCDKKNY
jgi:hypothetical protein